MSRKSIAVLVFVVAIVGTTAFASARYGRGPHAIKGFPFFRELGLARLEARLNLTADQTTQIRQITKAERMKRAGQPGVGPENREALMKAIFADNPNQTEIQNRVKALEEQHAKMLQELVATGLQVNKVFTPEQRAELQKMIDENAQVRTRMRERMKQHIQQPPATQQP